MSIFENIRLALTSLRANKLRSLLTMLGIIIGIGSVIAIVTIGDSITGAFNAEMSGLGARNVTIYVQQKEDYSAYTNEDGTVDYSAYYDNYTYVEPTSADYITDEMLQQYRARFADVLEAVAITEDAGSTTVTNGRRKASVNVTGVSPDEQTLDGLKLLAGRFVSQRDIDGARSIAVVSDEFVHRYFGTNTAYDTVIDKCITMPVSGLTMKLYIVGVYEYKADDGQRATRETVTRVFVPYSTVKQLLQRPEGYASLTVRSKTTADSQKFLRDTNTWFASWYTHNRGFTAAGSSMESMMTSLNKTMDTIKLGISAVAAISLLVGGIGVMNIMMVSVTERTREIGIRMALGAKGRVILFQFIVESAIICLIGGMIGVALGIGLGSLGAALMSYSAKPSVAAIAVAVSFSMAIGIFFGWYPAKKASNLDPIEALRYE